MNFLSLKPDTENNANFDAVTAVGYQANAATLTPFNKEDKIVINSKIYMNVKARMLDSL